MNPDRKARKRKLEDPEKADESMLDHPENEMDVDEGGPVGMDKADEKEGLKLLNSGCKEVTFWLEMYGERETVRITDGDFSLWMKVYPDDSEYYPHMDTIDFMLKKKGDPDFKFKAEVQLFDENDEKLEAEYPDVEDDYDRNHFPFFISEHHSENGFQHISEEVHLRDYGWYRGWDEYYYSVQIKVTVL